jgi:hypothetical protein
VLDRAADAESEVELGLTILPVWPICWLYPIQPESTAARVAPTAPPSSVGKLLTSANPSGLPTPRPPDDDPGLLDRGGGPGLADPIEARTSAMGWGALAGVGRPDRPEPAGRRPTLGRTVTIRAGGGNSRSS